MRGAQITTELTLAGEHAGTQYAQELVEGALRLFAFTENDTFAIKLALEEALVNAIRHGNQMDPAKTVQVAFSVTHERFEVRITDEGNGFDAEDWFLRMEWPDMGGPWGRGLLLMRGFMTELQFSGRGDVVTMTKVREP